MVKIPRKTGIFLILLLSMNFHGKTTTIATSTAAGTTVAGTTVAATTVAGTTVAGTTVAGTTAAATTVVGTTVAGTTVAGTTAAATTVVGTTAAATTVVGTTVAGTTVAGTTVAGTTVAGTTAAATTVVGTTAAGTTAAGTTAAATTVVGTTAAGTTVAGTTAAATTIAGTTVAGTTVRTSFRLTDEVYNNNLANPSSTAFTALQRKVEDKVGSALLSELGSRFVSIVVNGFTSGSVIVDADVTIAEEDQSVASDTVLRAIVGSGVSGLDTLTVKVGVCSDGFVNVNNQCLMFSSQRLTWIASGTACGSLNGQLVVPTDFTQMASYIIGNNIHYWQYWVGASATNPSDPGTYKWLDGTTVDSSLWYPGYPLTPGTQGITSGQSCVKLNPNSNTNNGLIAAWDTNCDGTNTYRYICEEL